jgi:hypothetical protein
MKSLYKEIKSHIRKEKSIYFPRHLVYCTQFKKERVAQADGLSKTRSKVSSVFFN